MKNNLKDLESKIAVRANVEVQAKISRFKTAIDKALSDLFGKTSCGTDQFGNYQYAEEAAARYPIEFAKLTALRLAIRDHAEKDKSNTKRLLHWPAELWEKETEAIRNDLLAKMDLMQQLLLAKPRSTDDDVPCEGDSVE